MAKLWEEQDQQMQMLHLLMTKLKQTETIMDNIAKQVHKEVAHIYFNITKVDQGDRNKLQLALIKSIKEKDKVKLSAKALNYGRNSFQWYGICILALLVNHCTHNSFHSGAPATEAHDQVTAAFAHTCIQESQSKKDTHSVQGESSQYTTLHIMLWSTGPNPLSCAGNGIFRDQLLHMGFRAANKYTIADPDHPNMELGHSQRSVKWWQDINLKGACIAKPGTKGSSLFKYVDFPGQVCELSNIFLDDSHLLFFQAPKREGLQIGEKEDKRVDEEEDKWVDEEEDKWVDKDEDRQEEEQVESHDTMACLNLCLPFFPLCAGQRDWRRGQSFEPT